ncbi:trypsin-like serine protease [Streptomyces sp. NPDC089919]|uniref:trypsin-like serine protease n=1 Tax=Streptomyces sp. NPDC089919 TaxID=3155188 RepID=UPI003415ADB3
MPSGAGPLPVVQQGVRALTRIRIRPRGARAAAALALAATGLATALGAAPAASAAGGAGTTAAGNPADAQVAAAYAARERHGQKAGARDAAPMIIGGGSQGIAGAPWMAQLHYLDDNDTKDPDDDLGFFCGGAVVSPTKIVTAAHCVDGLDWTLDSFVVVGAGDLPTVRKDKTVDWHGGSHRTVRRQWRHPKYDPATFDNDVAVLTLSAPVAVPNLPIARSTDTAEYRSGATASVYGWGRYTSETEDLSPSLKRADLPLVSDQTCAAGFWGDSLVKGHMFCAGTPASGQDRGTNTACNGDSGGPLVRGGRLIGLVSWGVTDCVEEGAYGVYAKVTSFAGPIRAQVYDADWSGNGVADLLARGSASDSVFPFQTKAGSTVSLTRQGAWGTAATANLILQSDLDRDGTQDVVRRNTDGALYWSHRPAGGAWTHTKVLTGWGTRRQVLAPGDVTGDDRPDLLSVTASGNLYAYPGKGDGTFGGGVLVGPGWSAYGMVRGHGDLTGDGKTDLVARDAAGILWLYPGTGAAGTAAFAPRVKVGGGWNAYDRLVTVGDVSGDGRADLLARDPAGTLWLYKGTGATGSATFATRTALGTGWKGYDLFG